MALIGERSKFKQLDMMLRDADALLLVSVASAPVPPSTAVGVGCACVVRIFGVSHWTRRLCDDTRKGADSAKKPLTKIQNVYMRTFKNIYPLGI